MRVRSCQNEGLLLFWVFRQLVEILYRSELGDAEKIAARTADYETRFANPFIAAERGFVDDVIIPQNSRFRIIQAFGKLRGKRQQNPAKKFGNISL